MENVEKKALIKTLIDKGMVTGKIDSTEIDALTIENDLEVEDIEKLYAALEAANIEIIETLDTDIFSNIPEDVDSNKEYVRRRLQEEKNEAVRKLLEADYNFLDEIQTEMSSARQFLFAVRFRKEKEEQVFNLINRIDKTISDHGFSAKRMSKADIKRMLALYFGTSITGDEIPDVEGENYFDEEEFDEE